MTAAHAQTESDVVIAGAGVAGFAAAISLAQSGLSVTCIDPDPVPNVRVGESLDWSSPGLLTRLGLSRDELVASGIGTYKRELRAVTAGGELMIGQPPPWVDRWPLRFERVTLHVERPGFDGRLCERAVEAGVRLVQDRVTDVRFDGDRIVDYGTRSGERFAGVWFVDATGRRRLIARAAGIAHRQWAPPRIAVWCQHEATSEFDGTMLYLDDTADDLVWAWEIPITTARHSLGLVMTTNRFRSLHGAGRSPGDVLVGELGRFTRFRDLSPSDLQSVRTRTYRPYVSDRVSGANWLMTGEAAAFADPITAIGVTAALRHASEAADLIRANAQGPRGARRPLEAYDHRVRRVAGLYNLGIETLIYQPQLRRALGTRWASRAYVPLGYLTNSLYSRLRPTTAPRMAAFGVVLGLFHLWVGAWTLVARAASGRARPRIPTAWATATPPGRRRLGDGHPDPARQRR